MKRFLFLFCVGTILMGFASGNALAASSADRLIDAIGKTMSNDYRVQGDMSLSITSDDIIMRLSMSDNETQSDNIQKGEANFDLRMELPQSIYPNFPRNMKLNGVLESVFDRNNATAYLNMKKLDFGGDDELIMMYKDIWEEMMKLFGNKYFKINFNEHLKMMEMGNMVQSDIILMTALQNSMGQEKELMMEFLQALTKNGILIVEENNSTYVLKPGKSITFGQAKGFTHDFVRFIARFSPELSAEMGNLDDSNISDLMEGVNQLLEIFNTQLTIYFEISTDGTHITSQEMKIVSKNADFPMIFNMSSKFSYNNIQQNTLPQSFVDISKIFNAYMKINEAEMKKLHKRYNTPAIELNTYQPRDQKLSTLRERRKMRENRKMNQ